MILLSESRFAPGRERPINPSVYPLGATSGTRELLSTRTTSGYPRIRAQHPVESNRQLPRRRHLRHSFRFRVAAMQILIPQSRIAAHRYLRRFHQQHPHEPVPLLADRSEPLMSARTVLPRNQPQITGHLLAALKTRNISHRQHERHRSDRPHARLRHQQPRFFVLLRRFHHRLIQQSQSARSTSLLPSTGLLAAGWPTASAASSRSTFSPALLHSFRFFVTPWFIARCCNSFFTCARNPHQLVAMNQQLPQILLFTRRRPDPRKPSFQQQLQNQRGIAPVVLLLPHFAGANLRRISDPHIVSRRRGHLHKPLAVPGRLHPDQRRPRQSADKTSPLLPTHAPASFLRSLPSACPTNKSVANWGGNHIQ